MAQILAAHLFGILNLGHWDLPFDFAQGGEPVEPFAIWFLVLGLRRAQSCRIFMIFLRRILVIRLDYQEKPRVLASI